MKKAVHKALSMFPEDAALLKELAERAGITESSYVRLLLKREKALIDKKKGNFAECPLSGDEKTSDESEEPKVEDELGAFSTEKLPQLGKTNNWQRFYDRKYSAYLWINCEEKDIFYFEDMMNYYAKDHRFASTNDSYKNATNIDMKKLNRENYK